MKRMKSEIVFGVPERSNGACLRRWQRLAGCSLIVPALLLGSSLVSVGASQDEPIGSAAAARQQQQQPAAPVQEPTTAAPTTTVPDEPSQPDAETKRRYEAFEQMPVSYTHLTLPTNREV